MRTVSGVLVRQLLFRNSKPEAQSIMGLFVYADNGVLGGVIGCWWAHAVIFICIFSIAPGNGDAFTSFLLGCPRDLPIGASSPHSCVHIVALLFGL